VIITVKSPARRPAGGRTNDLGRVTKRDPAASA